MITFEDIQAAAVRIADGVYHSPCPASEPLSLIAGCQVYCKLDYLQRTGSFKERGARNALMLLDAEQRRAGVTAASAGNHALGLAYHGKLLGIPVTVVMPKFAPLMKVTTCQQLGATVILHGETFDDARAHSQQLVQERGLTYVHGYDDPAVIAGQGTMGLEIVQQVPDLDAVVVPVGGGGLIAGVALAIKTLKPSVKVYGVEPEHSASYLASHEAGHPVKFAVQPTLADGLAVPRVGDNAFALAERYVDRVVTVKEKHIALAILRLLELEKSVVEGGGATPLAACLARVLPEIEGKKVVLPLTGGNIDTTVLGRIIERGLAADGRLCRFIAQISDRPGGLAKFAAIVAEEAGSIKDILHDRVFSGGDLNRVNVHCVVETRDRDHVRRLRDRLVREGISVRFPDLEPADSPLANAGV